MKWFPGFLLFFISIQAYSCENSLSSPTVAYQCILENHPALSALQFREVETQSLVNSARQRTNPEVEVQTSFGTEKSIEGEVLFPIQLGDKLGARTSRAEAESTLLRSKDQVLRAEVALNAAENLTQLRQRTETLTLLSATKSQIDKIVRRIRYKRALSPEDRTTSKLFELYSSTLIQKIAATESDLDSLRKTLSSAIGRPVSDKDRLIGTRPTRWPILANGTRAVPLNSRVAQAEQVAALAELSLASAEAWPDLKVGPTFGSALSTSEFSLGLKISMNLPLLNTNQGARSLASSRLSIAESNTKNQAQVDEVAISSLQVSYRKATEALKTASSPKSLTELISNTDQLFARGFIQPSSIVETYRSSIEALEESHATELRAVTSYFKYLTFLGQIPQELP